MTINFGKYKGLKIETIRKIDNDYYCWLIRNHHI
jgi:hypothetical protein